ncbi:unnamed protein product, partial [Brenthis ino]
MPYHRCSYFGCKNTTVTKSMFRFPWNDSNRLKIWLNNCGNMTITHLPAERLRTKYICIDHFSKEYLANVTGRRKRINRLAIPEPYRDVKTPDSSSTSVPGSPGLKVYTHERMFINDIVLKNIKKEKSEDPDESDDLKKEVYWSPPKKRKQKNENDSPECKNIKSLLFKSLKKLRRLVNKDKSLKKKFADKTLIDLSKQKFRSEYSKIMTLMQFKVARKEWTNKEREFCMSLYRKSPAAYKFMYKSGIVLASVSTVQRWFHKTKCLPENDIIFVDINNESNKT